MFGRAVGSCLLFRCSLPLCWGLFSWAHCVRVRGAALCSQHSTSLSTQHGRRHRHPLAVSWDDGRPACCVLMSLDWQLISYVVCVFGGKFYGARKRERALE